MMQPFKLKSMLPAVLSFLVVLATFQGALGAEDEKPVSTATASGQDGEKTVTIDFNDVDISVLIKFISELTGKRFIIDNNVKGKVTVISPQPISTDEAYRVFESVLEVNGFATVPSGDYVKIMPAAEARAKNIETLTREMGASSSPEDRLVTQLVPLTYADANEIKTLFTPLVSKNSILIPYTDTNTLIVTDALSNIRRIQRILKVIDAPGIGKQISVIPLANGDSEKMVKTLSTIFKSAEAGEKNPAKKNTQFVSDERTNSLIFLASETDTVRIRQLISLLDKNSPKGAGNIRVYYLENATAEDLAKVLQDLPTKKGGTDSKESKEKESAFLSSDIKITADKATNSLVITASNDDYPVIEDIIKKLDIPRSMVMIESLIMEVNVDKAFELGTQWTALGEIADDGVAGGSFNGGVSSSSISDLATSKGLTLGVSSGSAASINIGGATINIPNIGVLIKAMETNKDVQIISKPQLMTTDNSEATIKVGKKVPFQTAVSTSNTGVSSVYNSFEYKDVGLTLKITPHISKDRMVKLEIAQELSAVASDSSTTTPTTLNRSVETTVIVKDQGMLVIGGLIDDNISNSRTEVPILGKIPLFGALFRSKSKQNSKTNLYIFITPKVISSPFEAEALLSRETKKMSPEQAATIRLYAPDSEKHTITIPESSIQ